MMRLATAQLSLNCLLFRASFAAPTQIFACLSFQQHSTHNIYHNMHARVHPSGNCYAADPQRKLWPVQRACSVIRRTANIATELVHLERSCLADLSTEELELQLKKHGVSEQQ
jgi:hypothetical protein